MEPVIEPGWIVILNGAPRSGKSSIVEVIQETFDGPYDSVAAHSRHGLNVVVDVGHHDAYSTPLHLLADAAGRLHGLPVLFVGVRCGLQVIMQRRDASQPGREGHYVTSATDGAIPQPVLRWQEEVHVPGVYDLEVDTSALTPAQCAALIDQRLRRGPPPSAFPRLASGLIEPGKSRP